MIAVAELKMTDIEQLLERARRGPLTEEDCKLIRAMVETLFYLSDLAEDKQTTIAELRRILARSTSEKTRNVFGDTPMDTPVQENASSANAAQQTPQTETGSQKNPNGHGSQRRQRLQRDRLFLIRVCRLREHNLRDRYGSGQYH